MDSGFLKQSVRNWFEVVLEDAGENNDFTENIPRNKPIMNIILAERTEINNGSLCLEDRRAEHIVKVLRSDVGDSVRIGIIDGSQGKGIIQHIQRKYPFRIELDVSLSPREITEQPFDLVLALPRPIMLKRILSQVTALGVGTIHLVNAARVEKSFWKSNLLHPEEYRPHLLQGLEQAVDTMVPELVIHEKFRPFVEDYFPAITNSYAYKLLAHPEDGKPIDRIVIAPFQRALFAIGPEGGWVDFEIEKFKEQNFSCCTMGSRILKVDTAVVAFHSRLSAIRECRINQTLASTDNH